MSTTTSNGCTIDLVWESLKETIRILYLAENLGLEDVRSRMAREHEFSATKAQYELHFKKWGFRKSLAKRDWEIVVPKIWKRKREGKDSEVFFHENLIGPKKVKKATSRYGTIQPTIEIKIQAASPRLPEGIIIRTPSPISPSSPMVNSSSRDSRPVRCILSSTNVGPNFIDDLPFVQFSVNFPPTIPKAGSSGLPVLPKDICYSLFHQLTTRAHGEASEVFGQIVKALMPEGVFSSHPMAVQIAISQNNPLSTLNFLNLAMYLVSNNFLEAKNVSRKVYKWIKRHSSVSLLERLLATRGPTAEALAENFFRLAIDADDVSTVKKMLSSGIDPNEQIYTIRHSSNITPLQRACEMGSVELVRALIDAGADVDRIESYEWSALMCALDYFEHDDYLCLPELMRLLLGAGAKVNPGDGRSPLCMALKSGSVEAVSLLIAAGADVNLPNKRLGATPLIQALQSEWFTSDETIATILIKLLDAGANLETTIYYHGEFIAALEAALTRESIELVQLLLDRGACISESAFVTAVRTWDLETVKLFLKHGAQVTQRVIEIAAEVNKCDILLFLLAAAQDSIKEKSSSAALIKAIYHGFTDLFNVLNASGVELKSSYELSEAIEAAAGRGDTYILRLLLDGNSKHRPTAIKMLGSSLYCAIAKGQVDVTNMLLAVGADVNPKRCFENGWPLLEAIRRKDLNLTRKLLAAGAKVTAISGNPFPIFASIATVLPAAVAWGHRHLIWDIIRAGAEVNAVEPESGKSALILAIEKGDTAITQFLIHAGASINPPSGRPKPLRAAVNTEDNGMVQYLLDMGADPDEESLSTAVFGSVEVIQMILSACLRRYGRYPMHYGCCALRLAILSTKAAMIELLLANGVDPSAVIPVDILEKEYLKAGKISGLGIAIETDQSSDLWIVRMILAWVTDLNSTVSSFPLRTPLLAAVKEGKLALVKALIRAGGDVNARINAALSVTPLQLAVQNKRMDIIQVLLEHGADVDTNTTTTLKHTPLQLAVETGRMDIVQVLLHHGANVNVSAAVSFTHTPLQLAAVEGRMDIVQVLLEHGADVNAPPYDSYGATALQFAAIGGYVGLAYLLVEKGANVNAPPAEVEGRTALEGAAENGRIDMLQLLLKLGAQIILPPGAEQYERAKKFASEKGHVAARRLLESYYYQLWKDFEDWNPLATDVGNFEEFPILDPEI